MSNFSEIFIINEKTKYGKVLINENAVTTPTENPFKVRLVAQGAKTINDRRRGVTFEVAPDLSETRTVQYEFLDPVHAPGQIAVYKRSMSRRFQLTSVKLASRTPQEASINLAYLWTLRGWTMPFFGTATGKDGVRSGKSALAEASSATRRDSDYIRDIIAGITQGATQEYLGAPPQVLELSAYSRQGASGGGINQIGHLYRVPCVIESLNIVYPTDVDYIPTDEDEPTPMPAVMTIDISLVETQSPKRLSNFSLKDYRQGIMGKYTNE